MAEAENKISEVELRTVPNVRDAADGSTFVKDYLANVDDSSDISQELVERQYADIRQTAMQRGLRPTGDPSLIEQVIVNKHNVRLVYSLPVYVATISDEREQGTKEAVASEQTATGNPVTTDKPAASTADGETVDTSNPDPAVTGAPKPTNADVDPAAAAATTKTTTASTSKATASATQSKPKATS